METNKRHTESEYRASQPFDKGLLDCWLSQYSAPQSIQCETEFCNFINISIAPPLLDSSWGSWGAWSSCSTTCDNGVRVFHIRFSLSWNSQMRTRPQRCNLAQYGGSTSICKRDREIWGRCDPPNPKCRKFNNTIHVWIKTSPQAKRHTSSLHVISLHFFSLLELF